MSERLIQDPQWYEKANCATTDPEAMFPSDRHGVALAKAICANCVVVNDCLTDALRITEDRETMGVVGGKSAEERKRMKELQGDESRTTN